MQLNFDAVECPSHQDPPGCFLPKARSRAAADSLANHSCFWMWFLAFCLYSSCVDAARRRVNPSVPDLTAASHLLLMHIPSLVFRDLTFSRRFHPKRLHQDCSLTNDLLTRSRPSIR